jgi:predicted nucleic acid-binding protein
MNGNLIDTNVIIKLLSGDEKAVRIFDNATNIFVSAIVAGELFYGAFKWVHHKFWGRQKCK